MTLFCNEILNFGIFCFKTSWVFLFIIIIIIISIIFFFNYFFLEKSLVKLKFSNSKTKENLANIWKAEIIGT